MTYVDANGDEQPHFEVACQWNDEWTANTIPGSCQCEYTKGDHFAADYIWLTLM